MDTQPGSLLLQRVFKHTLVYVRAIHLGFVALLRTQPGSRSVQLLGHDTQKLSLVLCSVAVRRADVHHLEKDGDTHSKRYTEGRGTERQSECQE